MNKKEFVAATGSSYLLMSVRSCCCYDFEAS